MKEENVLKQPKKPVKNNNLLLFKFNATKIPKKKDAIKLTIEVFLILNPILTFKLFCIISLNINPKVLPNKIKNIEVISKSYILTQPLVILLGSSKNLLEAISTLIQDSLSLTCHLRKTDKFEPTLRTNNSLELIPGKE